MDNPFKFYFLVQDVCWCSSHITSDVALAYGKLTCLSYHSMADDDLGRCPVVDNIKCQSWIYFYNQV